MKILGVNSYHGDSSACLVVDGKLIAAIAEERFNRQKHWAGLPIESIKYCLNSAGLNFNDIDYLAINRNPKANFLKKIIWTILHQPSKNLVKTRAENLKKILDIKKDIENSLGVQNRKLKTFYVEHHLAHEASTFFVSPFEESAILTINSIANGKIFERTKFKNVFIQPAASDDGGAIGAVFFVWNQILNQPRKFIMKHAYWGPSYSEKEIQETLDRANLKYTRLEDDILIPKVAKDISDGKIVDWFQGRVEFGLRALGNRSIIVDPRRAEMKDILNERIKRREWFRPFAPSILAEKVSEWFEIDYPEPFMIKTYRWRKEKQNLVPAVIHRDGTGRLQTVEKETNPRYWRLIKEFENITGIPIVLNTSFNENEPILNTPKDAINCFLRTKMDVLVLENFYVSR